LDVLPKRKKQKENYKQLAERNKQEYNIRNEDLVVKI